MNRDAKLSTNHISLTVGDSYELVSNSDYRSDWISDSKYVEVNEKGTIKAIENKIGAESNAIVVEYRNHTIVAKYLITIVDWVANRSNLEVEAFLPRYKILALVEGCLYFSIFKALYRTSDSFKTKQFVAMLPVLPAASMPILVTPKGYFLSGQKKVFWSHDLRVWSCIAEITAHGLVHSFDYYYDAKEDVCFVYYAEYSCVVSNRHKLYRATIDSACRLNWECIMDFYSIDENKIDNDLEIHTARHIHVVSVDKYTGSLWVGVGDEDRHCKILLSEDQGLTFKIVGMGSQEWRALAIWFSKSYIYWNMDSHEPQKLFRIKKSELMPNSMSSYLDASTKTSLVNHPKETVADLYNGAMFHVLEVVTDKNEVLVLMAACPEGRLRDMQGRLFGIKENEDDSVSVQELISVSAKNEKANYTKNMFTQIRPVIQDTQGSVYFSTRNMVYDGVIKARVVWNN